jgi:F0F1-type ATP synthase membrane subunit b/b'
VTFRAASRWLRVVGFALAGWVVIASVPREAFAAVARAEPETSEEESPGAINWFDFGNKEQPPYAAMLINFGLLAFVYYRFGKKPVAEALKKHRASVEKEIEEAQRIKREAEARAKTYQAKLKDLEIELGQTKLALVEAGKGDRARIVKEAEEKAVLMQKDAAFLLEQETRQMRNDLQREAVLAALAAAEEILKKKVSQADQERLAEEFLTKLGEKGPFGSARSLGSP